MNNWLQHITLWAFLIMLAPVSTPIYAQASLQKENRTFSVGYSDSLLLQPGARFLNQTLALHNKEAKVISLAFNMKLAEGWRMVNPPGKIELQPGETRFLSVNLFGMPSLRSEWQTSQIIVSCSESQQLEKLEFRSRVAPVLKYHAALINRTALLQRSADTIKVRFNLANRGNVPAPYTLVFSSFPLGIRQQFAFVLPPGKDTIVEQQFRLSKERWAQMREEQLSVKVFDTTGVPKLYLMDVARTYTSIKQHKSAFPTIPVELELGVMRANEQLTYFGTAKGNIPLSTKANLAFFYRSKEFGFYNRMQRDLFNIQLTTARTSIYAGQVVDARHFAAFGNGFKMVHRTGQKSEAYFNVTLHNKNFYYKNDNLEAGYRYTLSKVRVEQGLTANFDRNTRTNSYLQTNSARLIQKEGLSLDVEGGFGWSQHRPGSRPPSFKPLGSMIGYNMLYQTGPVRFSSYLRNNSRSLPGVNRGLKDHNHQVSWEHKGFVGKVFFQSNQRSFIVLRDSIYNSDFMSFNSMRYGVQATVRRDKLQVSSGFGKFGQYGAIAGGGLSRYNYAEASVYYQTAKNIRVSLSSFNGVGSLEDNGGRAWVSNSSVGMYLKRGGVTGLYTRNPRMVRDTAGKKIVQIDETMNLTPSINFSIAKRLYVNSSFTLAKTSYDKKLASFGAFNLSYLGKRNGLTLLLNGIIPIIKSSANAPGLRTEYFSVSIRKKLNIPLLHKRVRHNLTVAPFLDENSNGLRDAGEASVKGGAFSINRMHFITDRDGKAVLRNTDTGWYQLDFNSMTQLKGYVPAKGFTQQVQLKKSRRMAVPFKKSRLISGTVRVALDSLSNIGFAPDGLKVVVTDTSGAVYSTLTDTRGNFFINVPAGVFSVSLNPEAFDEKFKPDTMVFRADLTTTEKAQVDFVVRQQKRKVKMLKK